MFRTVPMSIIGTPDDGQRNWPKHAQFQFKNKFEKLVHLVGFIIRHLTRCTVTWTSKLLILYTPHLDTICMWARTWGSLVVFRNQNRSKRKKKKIDRGNSSLLYPRHIYTLHHSVPLCQYYVIEWLLFPVCFSWVTYSTENFHFKPPIKFHECAQPRLYVRSFVVSTSFFKVFH